MFRCYCSLFIAEVMHIYMRDSMSHNINRNHFGLHLTGNNNYFLSLAKNFCQFLLFVRLLYKYVRKYLEFYNKQR